MGRAQGERNRAATPGKPKNRHSNPKMAHAFVHTVIDDRSRVAYTSEAERRTALAAWLHEYNHHRPHTAYENKPPVTRLANVPRKYN